MSIRLVARDLYRLQQEIDALEKQIEAAAPERLAELQERLRKVRAEHTQMRRVLDGRIDRPKRPVR